MPIYEYNCRRCEETFEQIVLSTREQISCPKCKGTAVEKQLSVFSSHSSRGEPSASGGGCGCTPQSCGCRQATRGE